MPKRNASASPYYIRRSSRRLRLTPPTTYYGSGSRENPVVINDTAHAGESVDCGCAPMHLPIIQSTEPTQADLDELCIVIHDDEAQVAVPQPATDNPAASHTIHSLPYIIREIVNQHWMIADADPVPVEVIPSLMAALSAVRRVSFALEVVRARSEAGINLQRAPSDTTSITIGSQDSTRSGGTEEYKTAELEDITDDDVV
jgi:hypothetical protein